MMQQNLVSGETKLADYWLLLFKITSVQGLCQKLRQMVVCLIRDGSRMVPRYPMAPDSSLLDQIVIYCTAKNHFLIKKQNS